MTRQEAEDYVVDQQERTRRRIEELDGYVNDPEAYKKFKIQNIEHKIGMLQNFYEQLRDVLDFVVASDLDKEVYVLGFDEDFEYAVDADGEVNDEGKFIVYDIAIESEDTDAKTADVYKSVNELDTYPAVWLKTLEQIEKEAE